MKIGPGRDIASLRHLLVQNTVAVEKDGAQGSIGRRACGAGHLVMIATAARAGWTAML
jgi:hypothetical protein